MCIDRVACSVTKARWLFLCMLPTSCSRPLEQVCWLMGSSPLPQDWRPQQYKVFTLALPNTTQHVLPLGLDAFAHVTWPRNLLHAFPLCLCTPVVCYPTDCSWATFRLTPSYEDFKGCDPYSVLRGHSTYIAGWTQPAPCNVSLLPISNGWEWLRLGGVREAS